MCTTVKYILYYSTHTCTNLHARACAHAHAACVSLCANKWEMELISFSFSLLKILLCLLVHGTVTFSSHWAHPLHASHLPISPSLSIPLDLSASLDSFSSICFLIFPSFFFRQQLPWSIHCLSSWSICTLLRSFHCLKGWSFRKVLKCSLGYIQQKNCACLLTAWSLRSHTWQV